LRDDAEVPRERKRWLGELREVSKWEKEFEEVRLIERRFDFEGGLYRKTVVQLNLTILR